MGSLAKCCEINLLGFCLGGYSLSMLTFTDETSEGETTDGWEEEEEEEVEPEVHCFGLHL